MSYLATVKDDLMRLVALLREELGKVESQDEVEGVFKEWSRELWELVEAELKTSFLNGKAAKGEGGEKPKKRFANWRKGAEG
jgi:hypothetical protein